jgi:hypothetical protein
MNDGWMPARRNRALSSKGVALLAHSRAGDIERLRAWAAENCMPAALPAHIPREDDTQTAPAPPKVRVVDI